MSIMEKLQGITLEQAKENLPQVDFIQDWDLETFQNSMIKLFSDGKEFFGVDLYDLANSGIASGNTKLIWTLESLNFFAENTHAIDSILGWMIHEGIEINLKNPDNAINPLVDILWCVIEYYCAEWLNNILRGVEQ